MTNIFYPPFYSEGSLLFCVFFCQFLVFVQDEKNLPRCVLTVMSVKVLDYLFFVLKKSMLYSYLLNILDWYCNICMSL